MTGIKITELGDLPVGPQSEDLLVLVRALGGGLYGTYKIDFEGMLEALQYTEIYVKAVDDQLDLETGTGKINFVIPESLDGCQIVDVNIAVVIPSTSGLPTVQLRNVSKGQNVLSTQATINVGHYTSYTATTKPVVANGLINTANRMRVDVNGAGTNTKGLDMIIKVQRL